jgi:putative transposase
MTDTIESMTEMAAQGVEVGRAERQEIALRLVDQARAEGVELIGPGGLLTGLTKTVLETALEEELSSHLGYDKHDPAGRNGENSRNGTRAKTVLTEIGPVTIEVPRDRDGTFDPVIVRKRQRRLGGVDQMVLSLTARGLTTGEVSAHLAEVYGAHVGKDQVSRITEAVVAELNEWQNRPLDRVYPVVFIDAIVVKVRDGQVTNKPFYVVIGVTTAGERDILGIWAGDGNEGAKYWLAVLTELKTRGVADVCIVVCDGLKGLPDAITTTWPLAAVQTCVIHLLRNTFRYAGRHDWDAMAKDLRPVYTAVNAAHAEQQLEVFADRWAGKYPAAVKLWRSAWTEFIPFLDYDPAIRRVICTTNAIESLNARYRRAVRARGHFPTEQAALKCLYLVTRSLDPTGRGKARWVIRWKDALNAFAITFEGRIDPSDN